VTALRHPVELVSYLYWLQDREISAAVPFEGWHADYTARPTWCHRDRARNAWHCRQLAELMREAGAWIGPPAEWGESHSHKVRDGNHRLRAAQYLLNAERLLVMVPLWTVR